MSDKKFFSLVVVGFIILFSILGSVIWSEANNQKELCQTYCDCLTQDCPYTFDYNEVKGCDCETNTPDEAECGYAPTLKDVTNQEYPCKYQTSFEWSDGGTLMERVNRYYICDTGSYSGGYREVTQTEYSIAACQICIWSDCPIEEYHNPLLDAIR